MAQVKIGEYIFDRRQPEEGVIKIKTEKQIQDYSYVAPELVVKCIPDPNNPGKYIALNE